MQRKERKGSTGAKSYRPGKTLAETGKVQRESQLKTGDRNRVYLPVVDARVPLKAPFGTSGMIAATPELLAVMGEHFRTAIYTSETGLSNVA
jgi:hypothetical protein